MPKQLKTIRLSGRHPVNGLTTIDMLLSCDNSHKREHIPADQLRHEYARAVAGYERVMVFDRTGFFNKYMSLFGTIQLEMLSISVEIIELRERQIGIPSPSNRKNLRELIAKNAERLCYLWNSETPEKTEIDGLTTILRQIVFLAHPIFYERGDCARRARQIFADAKRAYIRRDTQELNRLAELAEQLWTMTRRPLGDVNKQNLLTALATIHSEAEQRLVLFPLNLRHKLPDHGWIEKEGNRLREKLAAMRSERDSLKEQLS